VRDAIIPAMNGKIKILVCTAVMFVAQVACIVGRPTETPTAPLVPGSAEGTPPIVTQAPGDGADATSLPPPLPGAGTETLQILSPKEGDVVKSAQLEVVGVTAPDSVVTVNDDIIVVGADGRFQSTVQLAEGPNVIEILASDLEGNEASLEITVTYEP
jgi:hypothetical protein